MSCSYLVQKLARFFDETALLQLNGKVSCVMRKPDFCPCKNKGADQLCSYCTADQHHCFCYTNSSVPLLLTLYIQSFKFLAFFSDFTARFVLDLVGNPEERFSCIVVQLAVFLDINPTRQWYWTSCCIMSRQVHII